MTIKVEVIADSISPDNIRLTTFQLRYPRFIHSELMTHRVFSRNASSSRAIPVAKIIADIKLDPAMPLHWGANKPGMQAGDEIGPAEKAVARQRWLNARNAAIEEAERMIKLGLHKQIANRILEPWSHINVVLTATQYENFFALRMHPDAQPEIQALARLMFEAREASVPEKLKIGQWHLPYISDEEKKTTSLATRRKVSVARCARVSYLTHEGKQTSIAQDYELYSRLMERAPLHASPAEHQATPDERHSGQWDNPMMHGNLHGWIQFRKTLEGEFVPG